MSHIVFYWHVVTLHHLLDRKSRRRRHPAVGVVALHVAGSVLDHGLALIGARGLRAAWQRVNLGDDRDLRSARAIFGPQIGRHSGAAELDLESRGLERVLEQLGGFELLHAEFAEVEDRVAQQRQGRRRHRRRGRRVSRDRRHDRRGARAAGRVRHREPRAGDGTEAQ